MKEENFPPRLYVISAPNAGKAVVFRRGPSSEVATFLWDLKTHSFELGQWFKGRIHALRSDLSPDGKHMIYFAFKGADAHRSWTAVSKAPYLKAIDFFPKGNTWHGGGLFLSNKEYWLNHPSDHRLAELFPLNKDQYRRSGKFITNDHYKPYENYQSESRGVYFPKLERDGWSRKEFQKVNDHHDLVVFEKPTHSNWVLVKRSHGQLSPPKGKGCYWDDHILRHNGSGNELPLPDWEWADHINSSLYWAEKGSLYTARLNATGLKDSRKIHDFSPYKFEARVAPYE